MEVPPPARDPNWQPPLVDEVTTVESMATSMFYEDEDGSLAYFEDRINATQPVDSIISCMLDRIREGYNIGYCTIYLQTRDQSMN
jgi:hypothetical protein